MHVRHTGPDAWRGRRGHSEGTLSAGWGLRPCSSGGPGADLGGWTTQTAQSAGAGAREGEAQPGSDRGGGSERVRGGPRGLIPCQEGARPCRSRLLPRSRDPGQLPPRPAEAWCWTARGVRATLLSCMARVQRACPAHSGTRHHGITGTEHKPAPAQTASPGPGKGRWGWRAFPALAAGGHLQMGVRVPGGPPE